MVSKITTLDDLPLKKCLSADDFRTAISLKLRQLKDLPASHPWGHGQLIWNHGQFRERYIRLNLAVCKAPFGMAFGRAVPWASHGWMSCAPIKRPKALRCTLADGWKVGCAMVVYEGGCWLLDWHGISTQEMNPVCVALAKKFVLCQGSFTFPVGNGRNL